MMRTGCDHKYDEMDKARQFWTIIYIYVQFYTIQKALFLILLPGRGLYVQNGLLNFLFSPDLAS